MKTIFATLLLLGASTAALAQTSNQTDQQGTDQDKMQQETQLLIH